MTKKYPQHDIKQPQDSKDQKWYERLKKGYYKEKNNIEIEKAYIYCVDKTFREFGNNKKMTQGEKGVIIK